LLASWTHDSDCCTSWYQVECDRTTNRIISLTIFAGELSGQLPPSIGDLPFLEHLTFRKLTNVTGPIQPAIAKLNRLNFLRLDHLNLTGSVPGWLGQLKSLTFTDLSFNSLTGSIPSELARLPNLEALHLDRNKLTGRIPDSFGKFPKSPSLYLSHNQLSGRKSKALIPAVSAACGVGLLLIIVIGWFCLARRRKLNKRKEKEDELEIGLDAGLVKFDYEEIRKATDDFSIDNIVGKGGFGNVYRGEMIDGTEVAVKRFKNCSAAGGDASFAHEVEVIASVRHVNLVALRGYCIATTSMEGHQRIIVCELMKNGSLHDHLLAGNESRKLSWPVRQKIALGTAKGLAYLHYGAQPGIIHRDIKASNILLDDNFEAKVADFGLAKFNPEGMTHLSTRVAGTMGYVAPEYALYGQLTERSDVYSYGVVLLELLSGKKALFKLDDEDSATQPCLLTDWAWSLVKEGRGLDVVEDGMPELAAPDVLERYVLVAVLCSHPQLYARPTMDQVVKMLETELVVPSIPQRSIPLVSEMDDIERSVSSTSGSGQLFSPSGYHSFGFGPSGTKEEEDAAAPESRT
ncbi:Probable LRR receptor-like serine/threonine-protein kinase RKF3, partial [Linum perenne]